MLENGRTCAKAFQNYQTSVKQVYQNDVKIIENDPTFPRFLKEGASRQAAVYFDTEERLCCTNLSLKAYSTI